MKYNKIKLLCSSVTVAGMIWGGWVWAQPQSKPAPFDLDGTKWDLEITYFDVKNKKKTDKDTLIFAEKKIISEGHKRKGYEPTNYSVTAREDGVTTFGTMQTSQNETSFWQGEVLEDETIRGSLYVQDSKGVTKEYYLKGNLSNGVLKRKDEKPSEPSSTSSGTVSPPHQEENAVPLTEN